MGHIWKYLTSPGRSMTAYVLRLAPVMMAGWGVAILALALPSISGGVMRAGLEFDPGRIQQMLAAAAALAFFGAIVTGATLVFVALLQRVVRNRLLIAVASAALACAVGSIASHYLGATPLGVLLAAGMLTWTVFIISIAAQVGRMTSIAYALATPNLVLALAIVATGALLFPISLTEAACEERPSQERMICIIREERLRAMRESWERMAQEGAYDVDPEEMTQDQLLRSVAPATVRVLEAESARCDELPSWMQDACRRKFEEAKVSGPEIMTRHVEKRLEEVKAERASKPN